jgi:hypothetical protein
MITNYGTKGAVKLSLIVLLLALLAGVSLRAYESYHNPSTPGAGYCAECHPGFLNRGTLHAAHTALTTASACSYCHTSSDRDNPMTVWSQGNGLGCMGCHGLDYGETIKSDHGRGFAIAGLHKNSGYGLRRHHARAGKTICATCHMDENVAPYGENVINTGLGFTTNYYNLAIFRLNNLPLNPCSNEGSPGLDNDGDGLYDGADPDCTGAPVSLKVLNTATNTTVLSWPYTFDGWHVEVNSSLASTGWTDLPNVPRENTDAGVWQVTISSVPGPRYYRLSKKVL